MTRLELTLVMAAALLLAALLGWAFRSALGRLTHRDGDSHREHSEMAERLHEAKMERDAALAEAADTRESLTRQLIQREAELEATMETVGSLRREIAAWRESHEHA